MKKVVNNFEQLKIDIKEQFNLCFDKTLQKDTLNKLIYNIQILLNPINDEDYDPFDENIHWFDRYSDRDVKYNFIFEYYATYNGGEFPFYSYVWNIDYCGCTIKRGHIWKDKTQEEIDELYESIIKLIEFSFKEKDLIKEINKWKNGEV